MTTHELKSWPQFFQPILEGMKRHELRHMVDRTFSPGDHLLLREWDPGAKGYTGREHEVVVTYVTSEAVPCAMSGAAVQKGFAILSIREAGAKEAMADGVAIVRQLLKSPLITGGGGETTDGPRREPQQILSCLESDA